MYIIFFNPYNSPANILFFPFYRRGIWVPEIKYLPQCNTISKTQSYYLNPIMSNSFQITSDLRTTLLRGKLMTCPEENDQGCEGTPNYAICGKVWRTKYIQHEEKKTQVLAHVAQLVGASPHNWKMAVSIPGQGTYLGYRSDPQSGCL